MYQSFKGWVFVRRWPDILILGVLLGSLLVWAFGCAVRYDKATGNYTGALACVNITGPGFSWTCAEQSKVPTLPDSQKVPE